MDELLRPTMLCPHSNLPPKQREALLSFKKTVLDALEQYQQTVGVNTILAVLMDGAGSKNLIFYQPLPPPLATNRDPHALMAQTLQHVANLNLKLYPVLQTEQPVIDDFMKVVADAFEVCAQTLERTTILALHAEYAANLNLQALKSFNIPDNDQRVMIAEALQKIANLNRQAHVQEFPDS